MGRCSCGVGTILAPTKSGPDQPRQTGAKDRQRKAGGDLVDGKPQREKGEYRRHCRTGNYATERADDSGIRPISAGKTASRAHDHHAFDPEVEHP